MFKLIILLLVIGILGYLVAWVPGAYGCWKKLSDSTYDYRYHVLKGCQYQSKENGWLPYDRLRDGAI